MPRVGFSRLGGQPCLPTAEARHGPTSRHVRDAPGDASTHTLEEQAEAHPLNSSFKSKQFRNRDNCIKISVSFDYWRQMPVVNERRADRHVRSRLKTAHFCINLFNDVTSYLVFSLYFNYVGSSPRNPGTPVISIQQARASFLTSIRHSPGMGDSWMTGGLRPRAPAQSCRQSPWRYC